MSIFSGSLPVYSQTTSGNATWTVTVDYTVTPSDDLTNYLISLTLKAKRNNGSSYNNEYSSYVYYTINGVKSSNRTVTFNIPSNTEVTIDTYTYTISSNDINYSTGIPVEVYWYPGISSIYAPSSVTVSGTIQIPDEHVGCVYIDNGNGWDRYIPYVDNGTSWDRCIPSVDNGTSWDICR